MLLISSINVKYLRLFSFSIWLLKYALNSFKFILFPFSELILNFFNNYSLIRLVWLKCSLYSVINFFLNFLRKETELCSIHYEKFNFRRICNLYELIKALKVRLRVKTDHPDLVKFLDSNLLYILILIHNSNNY